MHFEILLNSYINFSLVTEKENYLEFRCNALFAVTAYKNCAKFESTFTE